MCLLIMTVSWKQVFFRVWLLHFQDTLLLCLPSHKKKTKNNFLFLKMTIKENAKAANSGIQAAEAQLTDYGGVNVTFLILKSPKFL